MTYTGIGIQTVRRVGDSLVVTIPTAEAEALGLSEDDWVEVSIQPVELRSDLRPDVRAAADAAWEQSEPGLRYLADK
jgi:antitoxin component of MazEF toxin-antitoxin module